MPPFPCRPLECWPVLQAGPCCCDTAPAPGTAVYQGPQWQHYCFCAICRTRYKSVLSVDVHQVQPTQCCVDCRALRFQGGESIPALHICRSPLPRCIAQAASTGVPATAAHRSPRGGQLLPTCDALLQDVHQSDDVKLATGINVHALLCARQHRLCLSWHDGSADSCMRSSVPDSLSPAAVPSALGRTQLTAACEGHASCLIRPRNKGCFARMTFAA